MDETKFQLENIGLSKNDIDGKIESINDLLNLVTSSGRLFRKSLKHILLEDIRHYFNNDQIGLHDELRNYFPKKGMRFEWIKFSNYFRLINIKTPELKATKLTVIFLSIYSATLLCFIFLIIFSHLDLIVHMVYSKIALIQFVLGAGFLVGIGVYLLGQIRLPTKTFDDLMENIIAKNLTELLTDDKKLLKDLLSEHLVPGQSASTQQ